MMLVHLYFFRVPLVSNLDYPLRLVDLISPLADIFTGFAWALE